MNPLKSKHYPRIMYLLLIIVSLSLLFLSVNILETANNKLKQKSLTGFAINDGVDKISPVNDSNISINKINNKENKSQEIYTSRPYIIFYVFLIGIISTIILTLSILRSTVMKNIEYEDKQRKL